MSGTGSRCLGAAPSPQAEEASDCEAPPDGRCQRADGIVEIRKPRAKEADDYRREQLKIVIKQFFLSAVRMWVNG